MKNVVVSISLILVGYTSVFAQYCSITGGDCAADHINYFSFGTSIDNPSACEPYGNFVNMSTDVTPGGTYNMVIGLNRGRENGYVNVYADWNNDQEFDAQLELIGQYQGLQAHFIDQITVPADAVEGSVRLRVLHSFLAPTISGCENPFWDGEDYTLNIKCVEADINQVAPFEIASSTAGAGNDCPADPTEEEIVEVVIPCDGEYLFTTNGSSFDTKMRIGTECCDNTIAEVFSGQDFFADTTLSLTAGVYYVTIEGGVESNYRLEVRSLSDNGDCYCPVVGTNDCQPAIESVLFGDIGTTGTACASGPYTDYTNISNTVTRGVTYTFGGLISGVALAGTDAVIWVDWNRDHDFDDVGELIGEFPATPGLTVNGTNFTATMTVPGTAIAGKTRMRIKAVIGSSLNKLQCGGINTDGEVEDYSLIVIDPVPENDSLCDASFMPMYDTDYSGNNTRSTFEAQESSSGTICATDGLQDNTTWHYFIAPESGVVQVSSVAGFDLALALFSTSNGFCDGDLGFIGCSDGVGGNETVVASCLTPGERYFVQIDGFGTEVGSYTVKVEDLGFPDIMLQDVCFGTEEGSITVQGKGSGPWDYIISDIDGTELANQEDVDGPFTLGMLGAGQYIVSVNDDDNCIVLDTVRISQPLTQPESFTVETICFGDSFQSGGVFYKGTGTYIDTVLNAANCDSFVNLDLTVLPEVTFTQIGQICEGDSFEVAGTFYKVTGNYSDTLFNDAANGCDSIIFTNLAVITSDTTRLDTSICENRTVQVGSLIYDTVGVFFDSIDLGICQGFFETTISELFELPNDSFTVERCANNPWVVGNNTYTQSGIYFDTLFNVTADGCDSIIYSDVTIKQLALREFDPSICEGDSFEIAGEFFTMAGTYDDTIVLGGANGCDSINRYHLTVIPRIRNIIDTTICEDDSVFAAGEFQNMSGTYFDTLVREASNGCDSIIETRLTVIENQRRSQSVVICENDTVFVGDSKYFETGIYVDTLFGVTSEGCHVEITTNLEVLPLGRDTVFATICATDSFFAFGEFRFESGIYTDTLSRRSGNGCDSIAIVDLTVLPAFNDTLDINICKGDSILIGGVFVDIAGVYSFEDTTINGCDSNFVINLTVSDLPTPVITGPNFACGFAEVNLSTEQSYAEYLWAPRGETSSQISVSVGLYSVTVTDSLGCVGVATKLVDQGENVTFSVSPRNADVNRGKSIQLSLSPINEDLEYVWTPNRFLGCSTCPTTTSSPLEDITYTITARDPKSTCSFSQNVTLTVLQSIVDSGIVAVPTTFTPNGDQENDYYRVFGDQPEGAKLRIYTRWGQLVFETNDFNEGWNGKFRNEDMAQGRYIMTIIQELPGQDPIELDRRIINLIR